MLAISPANVTVSTVALAKLTDVVSHAVTVYDPLYAVGINSLTSIVEQH